MLAIEQRLATQQIDRTMLRRRHEPGARVVGNAGRRPLLERGHERILGEIFGDADVSDDSREAGDDFRRLDPPDGIDGAARFISRHS